MGQGSTIDNFKEFLKEQNDQLTIISNAHFTKLDYIIELNGDEVKSTEKPENLVFLEK